MFIVIEGIDGSGKGTQADELVRKLRNLGHDAVKTSFPGYDKTMFGAEVGNYLNGMYGSLNEVPPKFASLLYALDRFEQKDELLQMLSEGKVVVCDRYVSSNMGHQASKYEGQARRDMVDWIAKTEFGVLGLPEPDITFLLDISPELSAEMVAKKEARNYTGKTHDLHEAAAGYLRRCSETYRMVAADHGWEVIDYGKEVPPVEDIAAKVFAKVEPLLAHGQSPRP